MCVLQVGGTSPLRCSSPLESPRAPPASSGPLHPLHPLHHPPVITAAVATRRAKDLLYAFISFFFYLSKYKRVLKRVINVTDVMDGDGLWRLYHRPATELPQEVLVYR